MYKPTMKMKIVFDEEKVQREGKYDINSMYEIVDNYFKGHNLAKIGKGEYADCGNKDDYAMMWLSLDLQKLDWFSKNIAVWNYFQANEDNSNWEKEDILHELKSLKYKYA